MRKDWDIIRNDYIRNPITQEELALKYKVTATSIGNHVRKGKWKELRKVYLKESEDKSQRLIIEDKGIHDYNERNDRIRNFKAIVKKFQDKLISDDKNLIKIKSSETLANSMAEVSKHIELLEGNPTDRQEITPKEKEERLSRLREHLLHLN